MPARTPEVALWAFFEASERGVSARRVFVDLGAIACWLVVWFISVAVGWELGLMMVSPEERYGYQLASGIWGVVFISPLGLMGKRHVLVFIACGAAVGLAITLWPALAWVFPWATW